MLDAFTSRALLNKSYNEAYDLIESIAANNYQWPTARVNSAKKVANIQEINDVFVLSAHIASLTNMLKAVTTSSSTFLASLVVSASLVSLVSSVSPVIVEQNVSSMDSISCVYCGGRHLYEDCPNNLVSMNYVGIIMLELDVVAYS